MGRPSRRIGRTGHVSWWPAVREYLKGRDGYTTCKQIIGEAQMLKSKRSLASSRHCPHSTTMSKFLKREPYVSNRKTTYRTVTGARGVCWEFKWEGDEDSDE
tara:strand:+ start:295 stop:600 length:306 start_codon:yes stop_codon:yes gene_type:complete